MGLYSIADDVSWSCTSLCRELFCSVFQALMLNAVCSGCVIHAVTWQAKFTPAPFSTFLAHGSTHPALHCWTACSEGLMASQPCCSVIWALGSELHGGIISGSRSFSISFFAPMRIKWLWPSLKTCRGHLSRLLETSRIRSLKREIWPVRMFFFLLTVKPQRSRVELK